MASDVNPEPHAAVDGDAVGDEVEDDSATQLANSSAGDERDVAASGLGRTALTNSARLAVALMLSWILSLVGRFLMPVLLGKDEFGDLAFIESIAILVLSLMSFGVGDYIRKDVTERPEHAADFVRPLMRVQFVSGAVISAFLLVGFLTASGAELALVALGFGLWQVALLLGQTHAALLQARHDVRVVSVSAIVTKALWFVLLLGVYFAGFELLALPVALLVSEIVRTVWLGRAVRAGFGSFPDAPLAAARPVIRKSLPFYINSLNVQFMEYSVRIVVGIIGTTVAVGFLTTAILASTVPMLLTPILGWIAIPVFTSVRARGGPDELWQRVGQMVDILSVVVMAGGVFLYALSDWLIPLLFGDEFAPSGPAFAFLALTVPATYVTQVIGSAFIADDRSWQNTRVNIATMLFVLGGVIAVILVAGNDDDGRTAWLAAIVIAAGEWITVATLVVLRPFRLISWPSAVRMVIVLAALVVASVEKLGDDSDALVRIAVGLAVLAAISDVPRLLAQGRLVMRSDGDDDDEDASSSAQADVTEEFDFSEPQPAFPPPPESE